MYGGLIVCQNLHAPALAEEDIAQCGVLKGVIGLKIILQSSLPAAGSTLHKLVNVRAADCNGQQAHGCEHGKTAPHIIGHHESLIAFLVSQMFQAAPGLVGGGVDPSRSPLLAVLLLQDSLEHPESDGRLCGGT